MVSLTSVYSSAVLSRYARLRLICRSVLCVLTGPQEPETVAVVRKRPPERSPAALWTKTEACGAENETGRLD